MIATSLKKRFARFAGCLAALTVALTAATGNVAAANEGCGEFSYGFEGTRLLNDGISTSAGPFPISLPAGTYDLTMVSSDDHTSGQFHGEQSAEQWYVCLLYTSPSPRDLSTSRMPSSA